MKISTPTAIHTVDQLLTNYILRTPMISDVYLQNCARYFDLEAMYRPKPPVRKPAPRAQKPSRPRTKRIDRSATN